MPKLIFCVFRGLWVIYQKNTKYMGYLQGGELESVLFWELWRVFRGCRVWRWFSTIMPIISQHHLATKATSSSVRLPKRATPCCGETLCAHRKRLKIRSAPLTICERAQEGGRWHEQVCEPSWDFSLCEGLRLCADEKLYFQRCAHMLHRVYGNACYMKWVHTTSSTMLVYTGVQQNNQFSWFNMSA